MTTPVPGITPNLVITQLRQYTNCFATIAGAEEFNAIFDPNNGSLKIPLPGAFVVWEGDEPEENTGVSYVNQQLNDKFSVYVVAASGGGSNVLGDRRGQQVDQWMASVARPALWSALLGYQFPNIQQFLPTFYRGAKRMQSENSRTVFVFDFEVPCRLIWQDGWLPTSVPLGNIVVTLGEVYENGVVSNVLNTIWNYANV